MNSKLMTDSELRNIDTPLVASMSSNNMEGILQRPLIYPTCEELGPVYADPCQYLKSEDADTRGSEIYQLIYPTCEELRPVYADPCQYLKSEDADTRDGEISESGWTIYFDDCVDSCGHKNTTSQFDVDQEQKKSSMLTEAPEKYPIYDCWASRIPGNEEDSSMASDASSGPQKLPFPVRDIKFEQGLQIAGSYSSVAIRKRDVHVHKGEDSEFIASCSLMDVAPRKHQFRRLNKDKDDDLLLQDTATSPVHSLEAEAVNTR